MSEVRHYIIKQTREVEVTANDELGAIAIAQAAFENGQNTDNGVKQGPTGVWGNTDNRVIVTEVNCKRMR